MKIEFDPETPTAVQESLEVRAILGGMLIANIEGVKLKSTTWGSFLYFTAKGDCTDNPSVIPHIGKLKRKLIKILMESFDMGSIIICVGL